MASQTTSMSSTASVLQRPVHSTGSSCLRDSVPRTVRSSAGWQAKFCACSGCVTTAAAAAMLVIVSSTTDMSDSDAVGPSFLLWCSVRKTCAWRGTSHPSHTQHISCWMHGTSCRLHAQHRIDHLPSSTTLTLAFRLYTGYIGRFIVQAWMRKHAEQAGMEMHEMLESGAMQSWAVSTPAV